jgi:hypothetical protein
MQTTIENIIDEFYGDASAAVHEQDKNLFDYVIRKLQMNLKNEQKQIEDAYWAGLNGAINDYSECKKFGDKNTIVGGGATKYYKTTFNK